ncbi:MAG: xylose isomerase [Planctomycetota bacterium]|nr:MAG: xylose isomerase [Planctomycetota bacterium]
MHRRTFLRTAAAAAGLALLPSASLRAAESSTFTLNYAPHFGMFRHSAGKDLVAQLDFAADRGFRSWEDNGMKSRPVADQQRVASAMERLGMQMGVISCTRGTSDKLTFTSEDKDVRDGVVEGIKSVVDVAKRVRATWLTAVLGDVNPKLEPEYQTVLAVDLLNRCCDVLEPHGLVMVMEPLNHWTNHPGKFLVRSPQAFALCKAVNRPSCKILFDIYHQQVSEGNLIANIDRCWDEIAYFQIGDNPGRHEPGTGEIHYANVLEHLHQRGYTGILGMEHGNARPGAAGEMAVIEAYRAVDPH